MVIELSIMRKNRQKEISSNSISRARARMFLDSKHGFRTSNMGAPYGPHPDESVSYSVESFMRPHEIDSSAAIFSAQKIREVNYKQRRRKVDEDRSREGVV